MTKTSSPDPYATEPGAPPFDFDPPTDPRVRVASQMNVLIGKWPALLLLWSHVGLQRHYIALGSNGLKRQLPYGLVIPIGLYQVPGDLRMAEAMAERLADELDRLTRNRTIAGIGRDMHRAAELLAVRTGRMPHVPLTSHHTASAKLAVELMETIGLFVYEHELAPSTSTLPQVLEARLLGT